MKANVRELISKAEYARRRGCAKSAVTRALREGRITGNANGLIDPDVADAQWATNTRPRRNSKPASADLRKPTTTPVRRHARELVPVDDIESRALDVFRAFRDALLSLPAHCAPLVVGTTDTRAIEATIDGELRKILSASEKRMQERLRRLGVQP